MFVKVHTLLMGMLSAFALGTAVGMLSAPAAGKRTIRRIERKRREIGNRASAALLATEQLVDSVRHPLA